MQQRKDETLGHSNLGFFFLFLYSIVIFLRPQEWSYTPEPIALARYFIIIAFIAYLVFQKNKLWGYQSWCLLGLFLIIPLSGLKNGWLGGGVAAMLIAISSNDDSHEAKVVVYRLLARVHAFLIAPGAIITTISGVILTTNIVTAGGGDRLGTPGMAIMQVGGLLAAVLMVAVSLPTANRRAAIIKFDSNPDQDAILAQLRKRQIFASLVAGILIVASVWGVS